MCAVSNTLTAVTIQGVKVVLESKGLILAPPPQPMVLPMEVHSVRSRKHHSNRKETSLLYVSELKGLN